MHSIKFSQQWNNKMLCQAFSTFRIWNPEKYVIGRVFVPYLLDKAHERDITVLVAATPVMLKDITPAMAYLDTGYDLPDFLKILHTMYKDYISQNGENAMFGQYIFKWKSKLQLLEEQKLMHKYEQANIH